MQSLHSLCPICKCKLSRVDGSAVCQNGHSFDFAKEGYLYLLKPNDKNSQYPGDNKTMVNARRDFLDGKFYKPLADKIASIIDAHFESGITLIDAGVGTGFYLGNIIENRKRHDDVYLGADISKWAVRIASKRNPQAECCVANVYQLPYEDKCADVITCVFSPYAMDEYARLLNDDGMLIVASPSENHLIELRQALYENVRKVETPLVHNGFDIVESVNVSYQFELTNSTQIANLLTMTPYVYRAPLDKVEQIKHKNSLVLTADFRVDVLKKTIS